ncbi:hypothetical protein BVRB_000010, partial [Beta vulgaris subsp. vulgaris]
SFIFIPLRLIVISFSLSLSFFHGGSYGSYGKSCENRTFFLNNGVVSVEAVVGSKTTVK